MARKRRSQGGESHADSKRRRYDDAHQGDDRPSAEAQAQLDSTYGQRGAFPGVDDQGDGGELFYGPANDGLEYIRMVRAEANGVPHLLTAPKVQAVETLADQYTTTEGHYADGAYTAVPVHNDPSLQRQNKEAEVESEIDPQEAYYAALLQRFREVATELRHPSIAPTLEPTTIDSLQRLASASHKEWRTHITRDTPRPTLLYGLPQEAVLRGMEALTTLLRSGRKEDTSRWTTIGAWGWSLLAKCRDISEMTSEEVSVCRELGKEAIWVLRVAGSGATQTLGMEQDQAEENGDQECSIPDDSNFEANNGNSQGEDHDHTQAFKNDANDTVNPDASQNPSGPPDESQLLRSLTLDMIITIVGEMYGQRDLLEARFIWGEKAS